MQHINPDYLSEDKKQELAKAFSTGKPYPHIVMDQFLREDTALRMFEQFPSFDKFGRHYKGLNENKSEGSLFDTYDPIFKEVKDELSSDAFSKWIGEVTGIEESFITDDNLGAGLHQGGNGSFLDIHIDFNIHPKKNVHRRLNLLIYLNKDWKPDYNGAMEMWDEKMTKCEKEVMCNFNRALIFETSEISYHGYTKALNLPEGVSRKSFFAYFYTHKREGAAKYHDTVFRATPMDSGFKRVSTSLKEKLKNGIKSSLKKVGVSI